MLKKKRAKKKYPNKKHRSKFETSFNNLCIVNGYTLGYETSVLPFVTPPEKRRYYPDWTIKEGWYIETKGRLDAAGRKKLVFIRQQHPMARILVVFQRHQNKIYKTSKTTYSQWCDKEGIEWCDFKQPERILGFIQEALGRPEPS